MIILEEVGLKVSYKPARDLFRDAGAEIDEITHAVKIPEKLIHWALDQVPDQISLYGSDPSFCLPIGGDQDVPVYAGLGTPTRMVDIDTRHVRPVSHADMLEHIILINACENIHNSQMDVWPDDIPMTTPPSKLRLSGPGHITVGRFLGWVAKAICPPRI